MKKDSIGNYKRVIFTLIVMVAIISCSCVISYMISKMEEQACLDTLNDSVNEVATEIESRISSDQRLLASIVDIIASEEDINSPDVQRIINSFEPNTMISHIALLLPGTGLCCQRSR